MPEMGEWLEYFPDMAWCRDLPEVSSEGFLAKVMTNDPEYCSTRDNFVWLEWDSLGHLVVDTESRHFDSESSLSSSSTQECYRVHVLGRFEEGPCSSSQHESSCSSTFCHISETIGSFDPGEDAEEEPKDLELCFDALGHLISIRVCGDLRWHQDGWIPDVTASDSSTDPDSKRDIESGHETAGVYVILYMPIDDPSNVPSSSCDTALVTECEPLAVNKANFFFDSLGHLFLVGNIQPAFLPCGVDVGCCPGARMPKNFLVVWQLWNAEFAVAAGETFPYTQCVVATYNGCAWVGEINIPCCVREGASGVELSGEMVSFAFGCLTYPGPFEPLPWELCLNGKHVTTAKPSVASCCPVEAEFEGSYTKAGCDDVGFRASWMAIPCIIECEDNIFQCGAIESASTTSPGGGPPVGGLSPSSLDVSNVAVDHSTTFTGTDLTADVVFTFSGADATQFEMSSDHSTWHSSLTISPTGGALTQVVYVRKKTPIPTGTVTYNAVLNAASTGMTTATCTIFYHFEAGGGGP